MLSDRCPVCPVCLSCLSVTLACCGQTVLRIKMKLGMQVGLGPGHNMLDGDPAPPPPKGHSPPIFGPYPFPPNGRIDQDSTWYGGRPRPGATLCQMGTPLPSPRKGGGQSPQFFGPCLLWPNGWTDQDGTWHGGRSQLRRRYGVRWRPSPLPKKGTDPPLQFLAHFYCGQTAGCTKMLLGMELGLNTEDFVLDGDPSPSPKRGQIPQIFGPCLLWPNGWMDQNGTWHGDRPQPRRLCVRWGPSPLAKKAAEPLPNFRQISTVPKRLDASRCHLVWR